MKTACALLSLLCLTGRLHAQGYINYGNNLGASTFRAPIFGPEPGNPTLEIHGQTSGTIITVSGASSPLSFPQGNTVYTGARLEGTGFTMALYAGSAAEDLTLVTSSPFLTGVSAGFILSKPGMFILGQPVGATPWFEIRAWDNQNGRVTTWEQVITDDTVARGSTGIFNPNVRLGGITDDEFLLLPSNLTGWTSFNIHYPVPEPSTFVLCCLGIGLLLLRRCRQQTLPALRTDGPRHGPWQELRFMKLLPITLCILSFTSEGLGDGLIIFGNNIDATTFRAPIFGPEPGNPTLEIHGQTSGTILTAGGQPTPLSVPQGNTVYTGAKLAGPGFTMALYAGSSANDLQFVTNGLFLTGTAAGFILKNPNVWIVGQDPWSTPWFDIRAWDNQGGRVATWEQVIADDTVARGSTGAFNPNIPLGGNADGVPVLQRNLTGWTSFNIHYPVPEPSVWALGLLGLGILALRRYR